MDKGASVQQPNIQTCGIWLSAEQKWDWLMCLSLQRLWPGPGHHENLKLMSAIFWGLTELLSRHDSKWLLGYIDLFGIMIEKGTKCTGSYQTSLKVRSAEVRNLSLSSILKSQTFRSTWLTWNHLAWNMSRQREQLYRDIYKLYISYKPGAEVCNKVGTVWNNQLMWDSLAWTMSRQREQLCRDLSYHRTNLELKFAVRWGLLEVLSPCETLRLWPGVGKLFVSECQGISRRRKVATWNAK